jgi:hypothetical protein
VEANRRETLPPPYENLSSHQVAIRKEMEEEGPSGGVMDIQCLKTVKATYDLISVINHNNILIQSLPMLTISPNIPHNSNIASLTSYIVAFSMGGNSKS